jgi:glycosyltransferase involved in cell wall biosynthesis
MNGGEALRSVIRWPTVSAVVPTRDRPVLLRKAVNSILHQRYGGVIECLVVFDRSSPAMPPLQVPEGRTVQVLVNRRTPGLAGARNTGALSASGELVAFCDDDDEWAPDKIRYQVEALMAAPRHAVVTTGIQIDYEGRIKARVPRSNEITLKQLRRSRVMEAHPSTIVVRRSAFEGPIGPVDEAIPGSYAEDYEWLLRAARQAPVLAVQRPLVRVRWHRSSWFEGRWTTIVAALEYLLQKHPDLHGDPRGWGRVSGQIAFAHAAAGNAGAARRWALRSLRSNWRERRAYVALAVASGFVGADTVLRAAHARGRGI